MKSERLDASVPGASTGSSEEDGTVPPRESNPNQSIPGGFASGAAGEASVREVGRYQIVANGKIGEGAMATVYKAYDPSINRSLAIKFLHPNLCVDAEYRSRFLREARAAGMLSHPNIVTVFDVGEIEGRPYIAMELLDGGPLGEGEHKGKALPIPEVLDIGIQLAKALDYAHSKGIVHRDIKPSNIMLLKGGSTVVKVTDFGIARIDTPEAAEQTRFGTVLGTPNYMSPEQAVGQRVDARSDLFSTGVVLYELLTGKRPFDADSIVTTVYRIVKEDPKPLEQLRPDVPPALRRVVDRCLMKQPEKRFQSGRELAEALIKVVREVRAEADRRGRPRSIPLRVKWTILMAAVVAVTMAVTSAFVTNRQQNAMMNEMLAHGASLSKLIATESAVPALAEDWVAIDVFVQEVVRALQLQALAVIDYRGIVRVSSDPKAVGQRYSRVQGTLVSTRDQSVSVQRAQAPDGAAVVDFEVPITFQNKQIGRVQLGLFEAPLEKVARQSWALMILLLVVTVVAVAVATYLMAARYSKPMQLLKDSMDAIGHGQFSYRIAEVRLDDFGILYRAFDQMAEQLEHQQPPPALDTKLATTDGFPDAPKTVT